MTRRHAVKLTAAELGRLRDLLPAGDELRDRLEVRLWQAQAGDASAAARAHEQAPPSVPDPLPPPPGGGPVRIPPREAPARRSAANDRSRRRASRR